MAGPAVDAFNELPDAEATGCLLACLHAPSWAGAVLAGRPYPDRESLLATAYRFGVVLDEADLISALSAHPRSGALAYRQLHERLADDPEVEANVVRDQLAQIAQLSLDRVLEELDGR